MTSGGGGGGGSGGDFSNGWGGLAALRLPVLDVPVIMQVEF